MHNPHHANTHQLRLKRLTDFLRIVRMNRRSDQLGVILGSHGRGLNILERRHIALLVDLHLHVEVEADDYEIGEEVNSADEVQDEGVFEGDFFGGLHEEEDYHQVGAVCLLVLALRIRFWVAYI